MEKIEMGAGEQKIQQYIDRIKNGEDKKEIFRDLPSSFTSAIEKGISEKTQSGLPEEVVFEDMIRMIEDNKCETETIKKEIISNYNQEEDLGCTLFCGAILETVKHHFKDCLFAHEEIEEVYYDGKTTISDKTVDILATLGATTTPNDLIKLVKGDRIYIRKILDDFDKVFNVIYQEKKKLIQ